MANVTRVAFPIDWKRAIHFQVRDYSAMRGNFLAVDKELRQKSKELMRKYGRRIQETTKTMAPKDTWFMTDHVRLDIAPKGLIFSVGWRAEDFYLSTLPNGRPRKFYPPWVEYPTKINPDARPSLGPAYAMHAPRLVAEMATLFRGLGKRVRP